MNIISKTAKVSEKTTLCAPVRIYEDAVIHDRVKIGKYTYVGPSTRIGFLTTVGNYCSIARDVEVAPVNHPTNFLSTHPFQYNAKHFTKHPGYTDHSRIKGLSAKPTVLEHDVWIGAGAMICQGVRVGTGAVVAGAAVVTKDVPPYAVVAGVPAKIIKFRFAEDTISKLISSAWWEINPSDMDGIDFSDVDAALTKINIVKSHLRLKNKTILGAELKNNASMSKSGIIWFDTPFGYGDQQALTKFDAITVIDDRSRDNQLTPGTYPIESSEYDEGRNWYKIKIRVNEEPFSGSIEKNALTFRLLRQD